jgi:hypothetical protein
MRYPPGFRNCLSMHTRLWNPGVALSLMPIAPQGHTEMWVMTIIVWLWWPLIVQAVIWYSMSWALYSQLVMGMLQCFGQYL